MKTPQILLSTLVLSLLAACGGGGGGGGGGGAATQGSISGIATKGPVNGATVAAYAIDSSTGQAAAAPLATAKTGADGSFTITMPTGSNTGPVMLKVSGGTYTDEATGPGTTMTMAASDVMTAVLPTVASGANVTGIQVTPVTSMAQTRALGMSGGMTDANINAANTAMGAYFSVSDILHTMPMNPLVTNAGTGASPDAQNYGMVLAAMSEYAKTNTTAVSSTFVTAMMNDASDGVMDGKMGSSQITMPMSSNMGGGMNGMGNMAATAGTSSLATAMTAFMGSAANASGLTAANMAGLIAKLTGSNGHI